MKKVFMGFLVAMVLIFTMSTTECDSNNSRTTQAIQKEEIIQNALSTLPSYSPIYFMERKNVSERAKRFDDPNKIGYVYIFASNIPIGYTM
jgi:hypothetical protein